MPMTVQDKESRYYKARHTPRRDEPKTEDGFSAVLTIQTFIAIAIVIGVYLLHMAIGEENLDFKTKFAFLLRDTGQVEFVAKKLDKITKLDGEPLQTFHPFSSGMEASSSEPPDTLLAPRVENDIINGIASQPVAQEGTSVKTVEGAGGKFEVLVDKDGKFLESPSGITVSPVYVTAKPIMPVDGTLTSPFGYREHPITDKPDFHTGVDLAAPMGSPIFAAYPGVVDEVGSSSTYGNYIVLRHSGNVKTTYSHCSGIIAEPGANVRQGERIALVGSTGVATGPHLHFEFIVDATLTNPAWVLDLPKNDT